MESKWTVPTNCMTTVHGSTNMDYESRLPWLVLTTPAFTNYLRKLAKWCRGKIAHMHNFKIPDPCINRSLFYSPQPTPVKIRQMMYTDKYLGHTITQETTATTSPPRIIALLLPILSATWPNIKFPSNHPSQKRDEDTFCRKLFPHISSNYIKENSKIRHIISEYFLKQMH